MKLWITGGTGFLGSALTRAAKARGIDVISTGRDECDLLYSREIASFRQVHQPTHIIHAAALVGGIGANRARPADFLTQNLLMGTMLIESAAFNHSSVVPIEKFVTIGTVCSYPAETPTPFNEDDLWNGYPEPTNAPYGLAKKMLLVMGQAYRQQYGFNSVYVMPTNLYGPGDHFGEGAHVIPNLIEKVAAAMANGEKKVTLWGDGSPTRDFLYVDDAAEAIMRTLESYDDPQPLNLGSGKEVSIKDLAVTIAIKMGFVGEIVWDKSYPNGQMRRQLDSTRAEKALGWKATTSFEDGLERTIAWYREAVAR